MMVGPLEGRFYCVKLYAIVIAILSVFQGCNGPDLNEIEISGKVRFARPGFILFQRMYPDRMVTLDTISLVNNQYFQFSHRIDTPDFYSLDFFGQQRVNLILNESNIDLIVDGNDPYGSGEIFGSQEHDLLKGFRNLMDSLKGDDQQKLFKFSVKKAIIEGDDKKVDSLALLGKEREKEKQKIYKEYWTNQPLTLSHLQGFTEISDTTFHINYINQLETVYPTSSWVDYWLNKYGLIE